MRKLEKLIRTLKKENLSIAAGESGSGGRDKIKKQASGAAIDLVYKRINEKSDQRQKTKDLAFGK